MDWIDFLSRFFAERGEILSKVLDAGGCREGWVQAELFLFGKKHDLQTNATSDKFDLYCKSHPGA